MLMRQALDNHKAAFELVEEGCIVLTKYDCILLNQYKVQILPEITQQAYIRKMFIPFDSFTLFLCVSCCIGMFAACRLFMRVPSMSGCTFCPMSISPRPLHILSWHHWWSPVYQTKFTLQDFVSTVTKVSKYNNRRQSSKSIVATRH